MATAFPSEASLSEELTCSVCCELMTDPVMLDCMHHFCRGCIMRFWNSSPREPSCPHCRRTIPNKFVKTNHLLKKVVALVKKCSTAEYYNKIQNDLKEMLKSQEGQVEALFLKKEEAERKICRIQETGNDTRRHIVSEFQHLHEILLKEEKQLLSSVDKEQEKTLTQLREIVQKLEKQIEDLTGDISFIRETLTKSGDAFFVEAEALKRRPAVSLECPVLDNSDLFYNKHKGPFQYMVWRRMLKSIHLVPEAVTYDKSTAHPSLVFSSDLRSVTDGDKTNALLIGDKSRRFLQCINVLGSQVYNGGTHYWEVWVGNKTKWDLGVASDNVDRKVRVKLNPKNGYWTIRMIDVCHYVAATDPWTTLEINGHLRKIGIYLDCGGEEVIFYDAENMNQLFTFTDVKAKAFCPFFSTGFHHGDRNSEPMRICHIVL